MELLKCKARLAVLWLIMAIGTVLSGLFMLLMPGGIENIMAGEMGNMQIETGMVIFALFFLIAIIVAILSLTIDGAANRWLSFVLGIIWGLWFVYDITGQIIGGETLSIAMLLLMAGALVVSAYIAYFAWKLPIQEGWTS